MKNSLLILFIFFSCSCFSQNYIFNHLSRYSQVSHDELKGEICYSNINDDSYFLTVRRINNKYEAGITDLKNQLYHSFKVNESKDENDDILFYLFIKFKVNTSWNIC
jgi:hypothetical protein